MGEALKVNKTLTTLDLDSECTDRPLIVFFFAENVDVMVGFEGLTEVIFVSEFYGFGFSQIKDCCILL